MKTRNFVLIALMLTAVPAIASADDNAATIFKFLSSQKLDLATAVKRAESKTNGVAYEAELERDTFTAEFEVHVVVGDAVKDVRVEMNGDVRVRDDDESAPKARPMKLSEVIQLAEAKAGGKAFEADCDDDRFDQNCEVTVATEKGAEVDVVIDTANRTVLRTFEDRDD